MIVVALVYLLSMTSVCTVIAVARAIRSPWWYVVLAWALSGTVLAVHAL